MRRPRPNRLTGSVRRLLAAAAAAGMLAMVVAVFSKPAAAAGLDVNVNLGVVGLALPVSLPPVLPSVPALLPTPTPRPPTTPTASLPGNGVVPPLCPPACISTSPPGTTGNVGGGSPTTVGPGPQAVTPSRSGPGAAPRVGSSGAGGSGARGTAGVPRSVGLSVSAPPPVEQLTPLAGISFGQAPYLWPLLVVLDLITAAAVMVLVRRTWSTASDTD